MGAVVAVEWSENCADIIEREHPVTICIEHLGADDRRITINGL